MTFRKTSLLAWIAAGIITAAAIFNITRDLPNPQSDLTRLSDVLTNLLVPVGFVVVGALIISRQPRNVIGWLLMLPTGVAVLQVPAAAEIQSVTAPPLSPSLPLLLAAWLVNTDWVLLIFPLLLIALLFPTGRPPSRRWLWVAAYTVGLAAFFLLAASFVKSLPLDPNTANSQWSVVNPIGFIPDDLMSTIFGLVWSLGLAAATLLCVASLFVRYRRAPVREKVQIKWLLYACGLFAAVYMPGVVLQGNLTGPLGYALDFLFSLSILGIPIAIGIAILRYRLYDIDILIRRTLIYAVLTGLLALVYLGSVILLQQLFRALTGQSSEIAIIISTLAIAAVFVPLRRRVQDVIDRRFYRRKYDAQKVLAVFGATVRDEVELDKLTGELLSVVGETMHPKSVSLWLKTGAREKG